MENEQKVPYRRLESAVLKFTKVVIPTDLERLKNHQLNIEKYRKCKSWDQLHKEHINAGRTVQQLRANIKEMETLFLKVRNEDILTLATVLQPVKKLALDSISNFLELHSKSVENLLLNEECLSEEQNSISKDYCVKDSESHVDAQFLQIQDQIASESWNSLEKDLLDLNEMVNEFSHLVHTQQEKIDSIEDHVNTAAVNVEEGTKNLGKALKYKLSVLPAAGALIGGIVGGPIGLLAGFKVAGVAAAIGGGLLGFTGGKMLQSKKGNIVKEENCNTKDSLQEEKSA
ncbi:PREDICTED: syntaxin-17 [Nanorana parkeri]|uniref:syntaxin-17 n=1 Tax=Nanorana parkeri TaxID=125878 RepID=UPI000854F91A|nr:PREDICTED: syntaxin-17 [Nanorana parkeri]